MTEPLWQLIIRHVDLTGEEQRRLLSSSVYDRVAHFARRGQWDEVCHELRSASIRL